MPSSPPDHCQLLVSCCTTLLLQLELVVLLGQLGQLRQLVQLGEGGRVVARSWCSWQLRGRCGAGLRVHEGQHVHRAAAPGPAHTPALHSVALGIW